MGEKRSASRHRVLKAGSIEFGGGAVDCTVRNFSESGAALDVESPVGIPNEAVLFIPADDRRYPCIVVWRKEKRIGVHFPRNLQSD
ncbi:MAG: PilZ domain-containing protein [Rhodopseudomonas sp.]|uniref:PilZ domain-containing protein n=1 Tax=Rhodopseudomonas sp. TaxID=1078 RepID=UPI0039E6BC4F